jgi:hypothetical protein
LFPEIDIEIDYFIFDEKRYLLWIGEDTFDVFLVEFEIEVGDNWVHGIRK